MIPAVLALAEVDLVEAAGVALALAPGEPHGLSVRQAAATSAAAAGNSWDTTRVAQISCYTGAVEKARQNVTLVVDEDLLLAARKVALDRRTSVNQMVREYLAALVEEPNRRRIARTRLKKAFETGLVDVGDRKWSRDDLYDR